MKKRISVLLVLFICLMMASCSAQPAAEPVQSAPTEAPVTEAPAVTVAPVESAEPVPAEVAEIDADAGISEEANDAILEYIDPNGDRAYIPAEFAVSEKPDEQTVATGLVVIGPDGSEYVWVPTTGTPLAVRDFGSYFSGGGSLSELTA